MAKQNVNQVKLSDEDLAKIQKAVEDSRPKGYFEGMTQQVSPKDAMQFVKENPEVLKLLLLKKGGKVTDENYDMLRGKIKEVKHHASELQSITNRKKQVPAWVLAKSTRASTDLSDITHYMDSQKMARGSRVKSGNFSLGASTTDTDLILSVYDLKGSQISKSLREKIKSELSKLQGVEKVEVWMHKFGYFAIRLYGSRNNNIKLNEAYDVVRKLFSDAGFTEDLGYMARGGMAKFTGGGGVDAPSEEDARKELEKLESEGKITLSVGNHGLIFMQIVKTGNAMVSSFKQSYESYLDALKHYYRVRNRFTEGGGVESTSHIQGEIDDIRNWDNDEIANYIGVPISYVARDRNRYVREAQNYMMLNTFETGGNIGFKELSSRVAKRYQGKAVAPKYQSQYGKRYSKSEAREVGDKVAGKVYWQQQGRKFNGGGGVSDEPSKYEVVLKGDRNYGKIGVTLNGWETDNRGRLYTTLSFDTGVSTYGEGEVEPINYSSRYTKDTYKNGGSVDGLSDLMYG